MTEGSVAQLCTAAGEGDVDAVERLVRGGVDINGRNEDGRTALIGAAAYDQAKTAQRLIELGADVSMSDDMGFTPVEIATMNGHNELAALIRGHGTEAPTQDLPRRVREKIAANGVGVSTIYPNARSDEELLVIAANQGDIDTVRSVLERGVDIDSRIETGVTALMATAATGHVDILRLLLDSGADVNLTDDRGVTAISAALDTDQTAAIELLREHGARTPEPPRAHNESPPGHERQRVSVAPHVPTAPPSLQSLLPSKAAMKSVVWVLAAVGILAALVSLLFREPGPEPVEVTDANLYQSPETTYVLDATPSTTKFEEIRLYSGIVDDIYSIRIVVGGRRFAVTNDTRFFDIEEGRIVIPDSEYLSHSSDAVRPHYYIDVTQIDRAGITPGQVVTVYTTAQSDTALAVRSGAIPGTLGERQAPMIIEIQGSGIPFEQDPIVRILIEGN